MMPSCKMNETKLEVNENYEEADLSDVDDDVFVRSGGRNGYCLEYDIAKKPLMTPRKKSYGFDSIKNGGLHTEVRSSPPALKVLCMPMCYIMIATFAMLGLVAVITFLTNYVSWPLSILNLWTKPPKRLNTFGVRPCDNIEVEDVWIQHFPKLLTESAFRLLDVNNDSIDDIVFGYATGADGYGVPDFVCDIYFAGQNPCFGGVLALDGRDGSELWRHWTVHEVYGLNCQEDITGDNIRDCLVAGRAGVFCAISGSDGAEIWGFEEGPAKNSKMNIYTAQFIRDVNNDGTVDILAVHGGDPLAEPGSLTRLTGRLLIMSGKTGEVLQWVETPDGRESYYSPQIMTGSDGIDYVLFGTGGETHGGGLYVISLGDLYKGIIKTAKLIYRDERKGVMIPPVLTDITGDGVDDIIMAMFNSTVVAFDGNSFQQIWNHTFPNSETYTTPTPGYFNEDEIPDFLVKYQTGPGFPVYYHAQTTVLDGKTGKPLLENPIIDTIGSQASTPLIRTEGFGNDIFLYWSSNCKGFEGNSSEFSFKKGTNVHEQSRSDLCKLRFGSKLVNQLRAFNRVTGASGIVVYDSEEKESTEYNNTLDTSQLGQAYLQLHPEMWQYFDQVPDQPQQQQFQQQQQQNYKLLRGNQDMVVSETIPSYPASALMPGAVSSGNIYGYPLGVASNIYDISSQPEMTEEMKYPMYHNVRKHGNYMGNLVMGPGGQVGGGGIPVINPGGVGNVGPIPQVVPVSDAEVAVGMSNGNGDRGLGAINLNRREYQEGLNPSTHGHHHSQQQQQEISSNVAGEVANDLADISPAVVGTDELWRNYYRTDDGKVGDNGFPSSGSDPYEKRSERSRSEGIITDNNSLFKQDNERFNSNVDISGGNFITGNEVVEGRHVPQSVLRMEDVSKAILEEKRHLMRERIEKEEEELREQSQNINHNDPTYQNPHHTHHEFYPGRVKRHIGPHDGGIQRLISTGTLVKSLNGSANSIDLVFATYWFFPAKTQIISAKAKECIEEKMSNEKERFEESKDKEVKTLWQEWPRQRPAKESKSQVKRRRSQTELKREWEEWPRNKETEESKEEVVKPIEEHGEFDEWPRPVKKCKPKKKVCHKKPSQSQSYKKQVDQGESQFIEKEPNRLASAITVKEIFQGQMKQCRKRKIREMEEGMKDTSPDPELPKPLSEEPLKKESKPVSKSPSKTPSKGPSKLISETASLEPSKLTSNKSSKATNTESQINPNLILEEILNTATISKEPSKVSSKQPCKPPSKLPSKEASKIPSKEPCKIPSSLPSKAVSESLPALPTPSEAPSDLPSKKVSKIKSKSSKNKSKMASKVPSKEPSTLPSSLPSKVVSKLTSKGPSATPSNLPSKELSNLPSKVPPSLPSQEPSSTAPSPSKKMKMDITKISVSAPPTCSISDPVSCSMSAVRSSRFRKPSYSSKCRTRAKTYNPCQRQEFCYSSNADEYCDANAQICRYIPGTFRYGIPLSLKNRPRWTSYCRPRPKTCGCPGMKSRMKEYFDNYPERMHRVYSDKRTTIIATEYGHLFDKYPQKRPLWGVANTQHEVDIENGFERFLPFPRTPIPSFYKPLPPISADVCAADDADTEKKIPILACHRPACPRQILRAIHRDYRGKRKMPNYPEPPPEDDDTLLKKLMREMQKLFNQFLAKKAPIIFVFGRPIKTISDVRRKYAFNLAERHNYTYMSVDDEVAVLAAKGARAIEEGNVLFEGFPAVERLALPICLKLASDRHNFYMTRQETIDMIKFLMLSYFPTNGYVIDGFPLDEEDITNFESTFYPMACGLYFLNEAWTHDKSDPPENLKPLYFRRQIRYNEMDVENACNKLGLRTLKVIGTETLYDDKNKLRALHSVVEEYLEAYEEILQGNEDILKDETLEYQTFGETVGYGVDLEEYLKRLESDQSLARLLSEKSLGSNKSAVPLNSAKKAKNS